MKQSKGFTLIEMLTVIGIVAVIGAIVMIAVQPALKKARDAKRKFELGQIGRLLAAGGTCYAPNVGPGTYDLADLFTEVTDKYPQAKAMVSKVPRDPKGGSDSETFYTYAYEINTEGRAVCSLSANLENESEPVTLPSISQPTPGRGTGVLKASAEGRNGSTKYFQVSN